MGGSQTPPSLGPGPSAGASQAAGADAAPVQLLRGLEETKSNWGGPRKLQNKQNKRETIEILDLGLACCSAGLDEALSSKEHIAEAQGEQRTSSLVNV